MGSSLHILPGDKGYGSEVLGLHLYVWAWILFQASVVTVGIALTFAHATADRSAPAAFLGLVTAVNAVAVFLEEGFHWFLPDNPIRYQFFYDVGILG